MKEASMLPGLGAIAVGFAVMAEVGESGPTADAPAPLTRAEAADVLKRGLEDAKQADEPAKQVAIPRRAAEEAMKGRPENILVGEALRGPMESSEPEASKLTESWRAAVVEAAEILEFEFLEESPLPDGFPMPPPVGEITVQKYPVYRAAKAEMAGGDNGAFMRLFGHITSRGISMTTPVEMNYDEAVEGKSRKVAMSFLYRNTGQGTLGGDQVKVQDVGELTTVTLGRRGTATEERVAKAREHLQAWLDSQDKEYRAAGPIRTFVYNSPYTPEKKKLFEVQLPIEPIEPPR
jgi:hypothetical protein